MKELGKFLVFRVQDPEDRDYLMFGASRKAKEIGVVEATDPFDAIKKIAFREDKQVWCGEWLAVPVEGALRVGLGVEVTALDEDESKAKVSP